MHWCEASCLGESPRSSKSPVLANRAFLQERSAVTVKLGNSGATELLQTGWLTRWVWSN